MASRVGRKRKPGARTKADRLVVALDRGTEHTQAMQSLYGPDGCDAIGRAYRAGLLGEGSKAKALLDMSRAISAAYWVAYETGRYQCALGDRSFGNVTAINHSKVKAREEWLNNCLQAVNTMGRDVRRVFDHLCIDINADSGPKWLDAAIWHHKRELPMPLIVSSQMGKALAALEHLTA